MSKSTIEIKTAFEGCAEYCKWYMPECRDYHMADCENRFLCEEIAERIRAEQTADKIVRCKDCIHWEPNTQYGFDEDNGEYHDYCELLVPDDEWYAFRRKATDYCNYGKPKTNQTAVNPLDDLFADSMEKLDRLNVGEREECIIKVRCKDCKHKYVTGTTTKYYICDFMDAQFDENGYCHHGERKEVEE